MKKGIYVKITSVTRPAWYDGQVGKVYHVKANPVKYSGGMGYTILDGLGGILIKDCEIVEAPR